MLALALCGSRVLAVDGRVATPSASASSGQASGAYASFVGDEVLVPAPGSGAGYSSYLGDDGGTVGGGSAACGNCSECYCDNSCYTQMWASVDYMMTWTSSRRLPALVTTGIPGEDGVLGMPSTRTLFGGDIGEDERAGGRLSLGFWLDECQQVGLGIRYFATETDDTPFSASSDASGDPLLARPFFNSDLFFGQDSLIVARENIRRGTIGVQSENDLMSLDAYVRWALYDCGGRRLELLTGYQFSRIDDSLDIRHNMVQLGGTFPPGTEFAFRDLFDVDNEFHGGSLGLLGEYESGRLTLSLMAKVALGNMRQGVRIDGSSRVIDIGGNQADFDGGLLALGSNLGEFTHDEFAVSPEAEIKALYQVSDSLEVSLGYSFLYWSSIALADDQIDTSIAGTPTVNASQLLGGALAPGANDNPAFQGVDDVRFWAQGITFGVTLKR